jgi:hypothetical protein
MKRVFAAVVLMLGLAYGQTAKEENISRIVLPNPRLLRCKSPDCHQVWLEKTPDANPVFPKHFSIDMNESCLYGMTAVYDQSVSFEDIRAAIDARYGKWAVPGLIRVWRVEPEKFAIQLAVYTKKDEKRNLGEAGTKEAIYIAFGGKSACNTP